MSKTALNVIAICVFAMTLSTLLGPLFHLSPVIPAIATFVILGLATVDNFTWQGQGATLILDWFASFSPGHRDRVLRHEAGHFLIAHLLGIPVTGYALGAWEAFQQGQTAQGGVRFDDQELIAQLQQGVLSAHILNRYGTVWMAGAVAETLVYGNTEGGAEDRMKLRTILAQLGRPAATYQQQEKALTLQARTLLQAHWSAYEALVEAMAKRSDVESCRSLIEQKIHNVKQV
jgi:hypothetical protein